MSEEFARTLGDEIEYWRKRRGLSRDQLGALLDVSGNTVGRWERADTSPDLPMTWRLAGALEIEFATLIQRIEMTLAADRGDAEPFDDQPGDGA